MVLAVIVGIGTTLFSQFTARESGAQIGIEDAMALVLAALALLGLGIFGPGIASGIISGGPQLGTGAAVGTGIAAGGMVIAGAALGTGGAAALAGAARGTAGLAGTASAAFRTGALTGGADIGANAAKSPLGAPANAQMSSTSIGGSEREVGAAQPAARSTRMKQIFSTGHAASAVSNALRSADHPGGGASIDLSEGKH